MSPHRKSRNTAIESIIKQSTIKDGREILKNQDFNYFNFENLETYS